MREQTEAGIAAASLDSLAPIIDRLSARPEDVLSLWLLDNSLQSRLGLSGQPLMEADIITCVALAQAAYRFLREDDPIRLEILRHCKTMLTATTVSDWPWGIKDEKDDLAGAYTTGRVLCDLGKHAIELVSGDLLERALVRLEKWLRSATHELRPLEIPFINRASMALDLNGRMPFDLRAAVGNHAQSLIHRFVSFHALGSYSQYDPSLLCLALTIDNVYAPNPLAQHERGECLAIALKNPEPLVSLCRSNITRAGRAAVGCSALEILIHLMSCQPIAPLLNTHAEQLQATLAWLEDHSTLMRHSGRDVRVFQSDLYPDHLSFDGWFNALVLIFLDDLRRHLNRQKQEQLGKLFRASVPQSPFSFQDAVCGGYDWPGWLKVNFLERVAALGKVPEDCGNGIVLFGPPGTGKTTLAKLITKELPGWQFIELSTLDFLVDGHENLVRSISDIFQDLRQLEKCVVFFDELELLILERGPQKSDWATAIITNVMLPELQHLHDSYSLIPIFATNHISRFDPAGRRPGRFDFILPVGLPSDSERRSILDKFFSSPNNGLPSPYLFDGIEKISQGSTLRELVEWSRQYKASGDPGQSGALKIWNSGFNNLRVDARTQKTFSRDIKRYAYPPGAL